MIVSIGRAVGGREDRDVPAVKGTRKSPVSTEHTQHISGPHVGKEAQAQRGIGAGHGELRRREPGHLRGVVCAGNGEHQVMALIIPLQKQ